MTLSLIDADADFGGICTSLSGYCSQNDFKTIFVGRVHAGVGGVGRLHLLAAFGKTPPSTHLTPPDRLYILDTLPLTKFTYINILILIFIDRSSHHYDFLIHQG